MTQSNHLVLLLAGREYEQEILTKASQLAQAMNRPLTLLHLTHGSQTRRLSVSLSEEELSAHHELDAHALISTLIAHLPHPVDHHRLVVDDLVPDLTRWLAAHPASLLLIGSRHHWLEGSLARLLIYKLPVDIQLCYQPYAESELKPVQAAR